MYIFKADFLIWKFAKKIKPDIFLSFASPYSAHVSWLCNKPSVIIDDTEHAKLNHFLYKPFVSTILTPSVFKKDMGQKQIKFDGFMELCALHPNYFKPNENVLKDLGINKKDKFVILRFVSWNANHDIGQIGLSIQNKINLANGLSKFVKVFISSEGEIPDEIKKYQINISPEKIHDVLYFCTLYIGEGATMASECAMLGTPAIYINSLDAGTLQEQVNYGLLYSFRNSEGVLNKALEIIHKENTKQEHQTLLQKMLSDKIDVTAFMVWFIENYPESIKIMKENPDYQNRFKKQILSSTTFN